MTTNIEHQAFSSEEKVQEIARIIFRMSDAVHHALRRLSSNILTSGSLTAYALLTEEYALRSRANILLIEANRLVILDFDISQEELIASLSKIEVRFDSVTNLDDLSELLVALMLFSNSIVSKKKRIISLLFDNLMN